MNDAGSGEANAVVCHSTSRLELERVFMSGQDMRLKIAWDDKTPNQDNQGNVLALFKHANCFEQAAPGCNREMRQLWWVYTSSIVDLATGCSAPMSRCSIDESCQLDCLKPGVHQNMHASHEFQMMPVGFGTFTLMLWADHIEEVIALSSFSIAPPLPGSLAKGGTDDIEDIVLGDIHNRSNSSKLCAHVEGRGAYHMQADGGVEYCAQQIVRYGTAQASIQNDSKFTAFGGLVNCLGRHYKCTNVASNCSAICTFEEDSRYFLPLRPQEIVEEEAIVYTSVCGDGILTEKSIEQCDDKNLVNGDGCSETCLIEAGWLCVGTGCKNPITQTCADSLCSWQPACSDGYVQSDIGEECDDFNKLSGDGCSSKCVVERGWQCEISIGIPPKSQCVGIPFDPVCGEATCPPSFNHSCPSLCESTQGRCVWYRGENFCKCNSGFVDDQTSNNSHLSQKMLDVKAQTCVDLNECEKGIDKCIKNSPTALCVNTYGSHTCKCAEGYLGTGFETQGNDACVDRNECTERDASFLTAYVHRCHVGATCSNTVGSYSCACNAGFRGQGVYCGLSDDSPCSSQSGDNDDASCWDDSDGCCDINECVEASHQCSHNAECVNSVGSYHCKCLYGLEGSGLACYLPGFYERNDNFWQHMGRDGVPAHAQGLVQFNTHADLFPPARAGFASWIVAESGIEMSQQLAFKSSYGMPDTIDELFACSQCLDMSVVRQRQCAMDLEVGSPNCLEPNGVIALASMAFIEPVKCSWEFQAGFHLDFVEFEVLEFAPLTSGDVLEFCHDSYPASGQQVISYRACQNFTSSFPPPKKFYARAACRATVYAGSVFDSLKIDWSSMNTVSSRFKILYNARTSKRLKYDSSKDIRAAALSDRFEMTPRTTTRARTSHYLRISVNNYQAPQAPIPCSLNHLNYVDFSSMSLEVSSDAQILKGAWRGTCSLDSSDICTVDLRFFGASSMEFVYTGCNLYFLNMPEVQSAVYSFPDQEFRQSRMMTDQNFEQAEWLYRKMDITFTNRITTVAGFEGRYDSKASIAWPWTKDFEDIDDILLHVLQIGQKTQSDHEYPGEWPELLDNQQSSCAVMYLQRVKSNSLRVLQASTFSKFSSDQLLFEQYNECNSSITSLVHRHTPIIGSPCAALMSILKPARGEDSQVSIDTCQHACTAAFETDLMQSVETCKTAWKTFLEVDGDKDMQLKSIDAYSGELRSIFVARLGYVGDLLQALHLSCNFNYYNRSCFWVNEQIERLTASTCPAYRSSPARQGSLEYSQPEYQLQDDGASICTGCTETLRQVITEGHCCVATALNLKKLLLDLFVPGEQSVTLKTGGYRCVVLGHCDATAVNQAVTLSRDAGTCSGGNTPNLECLSSKCNLGYTWPSACCPRHPCQNGGNRKYLGACWCQCPEPHTGISCGEAKAHIKVVFGIQVNDVMELNEQQVRAVLARTLKLDVSMVEIGALSVTAARRQKMVQFGLRVLLPANRQLLPFAREIKFYIDTGIMDKAAAEMGIFQAFMLSEPPRAISIDGFVCDTSYQVCPTDIVALEIQVAVKPSSSSISMELLLIIISAVLAVGIVGGCSIFCYMTRCRLVSDFVDYSQTPKQKAELGDDNAENPMDRPSNLTFETKSTKQKKQKHVEQDDVVSDTMSVATSAKSRKTVKSSVRLVNASRSTRDVNQSDFDDNSSVRSGVSGFTTTSFFSRGRLQAGGSRAALTRKAAALFDAPSLFDTASILSDRMHQPLYGVMKEHGTLHSLDGPGRNVSFGRNMRDEQALEHDHGSINPKVFEVASHQVLDVVSNPKSFDTTSSSLYPNPFESMSEVTEVEREIKRLQSRLETLEHSNQSATSSAAYKQAQTEQGRGNTASGYSTVMLDKVSFSLSLCMHICIPHGMYISMYFGHTTRMFD